MSRPPSRLKAILLAMLVTLIWSTSWILIKIGLKEVPALTFAGLRYTIAFFCLLPFVFNRSTRTEIKQLKRSDWVKLALLGVVLYTLAQGGQFLALAYLPSVSVSLILNLTSIFVAFSGIVLLKEKPTLLQWIGVALNLLGILIYFYPGAFVKGEWLGLFFAIISLTSNIGGALLGRGVNRGQQYSPLLVTVVSMGFGSTLMLAAGLIFQGLPRISLVSWGIILLLAVVNTAFAFTVWNFTQQTLTAIESSLINSTMLIQVAILAWIFLGDRMDTREIIGLVFAAVGVLVVQMNLRKIPATP
jgi:drug/metabolite transporter (DMT)-like permease